jgi:hypothetical protein
MSAPGGVGGSLGPAPDAAVGVVPGAHGRRRTLAQARFLAAIALVSVAVVLWFKAGFAMPPGSISEGPVPLVLAIVSVFTYSAIGLLMTLRRPEVRIGRLAAWVGIMVAALTVTWAYLALVDRPGVPVSEAAPYVGLLAAVIATPAVVALNIVIGLRFPTDHLLTPRWRSVALLALAGALLAGIGRLFRPGQVIFVGRFDNPLGAVGLGPLPFLLQVGGYAALGVAALATGASLIVRYSDGDAAERAQLRVFTSLTVVQSIAFALFVAPFFVTAMGDVFREAIVTVNLLVFAVGPLAVALAIARYRLYEIDHLVGQTFVYGALTAILAGLYAASLKVFQVLFTVATGESSDAALVITTLILVATFTPVKTRLDTMVARWTGQPLPGAVASAAPVPAAAYDPRGDPDLAALVDERIRAVLDERAREPAYDPSKDPGFEALVDDRVRAMLAERYKSSRDR